jgi:hypothetical protein
MAMKMDPLIHFKIPLPYSVRVGIWNSYCDVVALYETNWPILSTVDGVWFLHMFECLLVSCDIPPSSVDSFWCQIPLESAYLFKVKEHPSKPKPYINNSMFQNNFVTYLL